MSDTKAMTKVRVRFAPSPTGLPHLGNIRTTLFTWLFAKNQDGDFILRFEDTDKERLAPESVDYIQDSLKWLGLDWNEGPGVGGPHEPYIQSQRLEIYRQRADILVKEDWMYPCWCSPQRLDKLRKKAQADKKPYKYDRHCLKHPGDINEPHVLRFKIDNSYNPEWQDIVRGRLSQQGGELDDFICIKSDGYPTYNFANVVDDHLMEISHVIRGDEFIASTPKFLQVYKAFGWEPPQFAHLPQVLGSDKTKLSKRHGAEPVLNYRERGYLPEAIINFLALLGWNDGTTKELFTVDELVSDFSLERVQKSPAVFDSERLDWFNASYLRALSVEQLLDLAKDFWPASAKSADDATKKRVLHTLRERLRVLDELPKLCEYFFTIEPPNNKDLAKLATKFDNSIETLSLKNWLEVIKDIINKSNIEPKQLETALKRRVEQEASSAKAQLWGVLREILSGGQAATPPIWELIYTLGGKESLRRINRAIEALPASQGT